MQGVGLIRKLYKMFPQNSLITIYGSLTNPHVDYDSVLYDQPNNESLCPKFESV